MKNIVLGAVLSFIPILGVVADGSPLIEIKIPNPIEHEHRFNFGILSIGYERIKSNSVYAGIDAKLTSIWDAESDQNNKLEHFVNAEMRLGYNHLLDISDNLIPYVGIGFSLFSIQHKSDGIKEWNYATAGLKFLHQFGEIFEMGLHARAYYSIQQKVMFQFEKISVNDTRIMFEFGIPLTWHVGSEKNWEIQFEPYYLQIPNKTKTHLLGSRLAFGYRF